MDPREREIKNLEAELDGSGIMEVLVRVLPPDEREEHEAVPCGECGGTGRGTVAALLQEERTKRMDAEAEIKRHVVDRNAAIREADAFRQSERRWEQAP